MKEGRNRETKQEEDVLKNCISGGGRSRKRGKAGDKVALSGNSECFCTERAMVMEEVAVVEVGMVMCKWREEETS